MGIRKKIEENGVTRVQHGLEATLRKGATTLLAVATVITATLAATTVEMTAQDLEQIGNRSPVEVSGSVGLRGSLRTSDRDGGVDNPLAGMVTGSVSIDLYGLRLPFSFAVSTENRSTSQPFNRFGLSPKWRSLTLHGGHRNLNFSNWTLSGHEVFGGGFEFAPGPFTASFIAGRLRETIRQDTTDSAAVNQVLTPEFERTGYAGMLGYRGGSFEIELSAIRATDDTSGADGAAVLAAGVRPEANTAGSIALKFRPIPELEFKGSFGLSAYTRDVRSDTLAVAEDLGEFSSIVEPKLSTNLFTGFRTEANLNLGSFRLRTEFARIDPDYRSMGSYASESDLQAITVAPSATLAGGKLRLSGDLVFARDNVLGKKRATTSTLSPRLVVDWIPSAAFGLSLNAANRHSTQSAGTLPIDEMTRMDQQTPSVTLVPRYTITDTSTVQNVSLALTHQRNIDGNPQTAPYTEYATTLGSLAYSYNRIRSGLSLNGNVSVTQMEIAGNEDRTYGGSVGFGYPVVRDLLTFDASINVSTSQATRTLGGSLSLALRSGKHHSATLGFDAVNARTEQPGDEDETTTTSTNEIRGAAGYVYRF